MISLTNTRRWRGTYAEQAELAKQSLGHLELVGDNGEIQNDLYVYDNIGNVTARIDYAVDLHEDFLYDNLNRLQNSQLSGQVQTSTKWWG